jgi:hypothetical protein
LQELGATRKRELLRTHRYALQPGRWIAVNDARFDCHVEHMPKAGNRVVVAHRGSDLAKLPRPFGAIRFRDPARLALRQSRPTLEQGCEYLFPVMPRTRLDRHVVVEVLLMDRERLGEGHFR